MLDAFDENRPYFWFAHFSSIKNLLNCHFLLLFLLAGPPGMILVSSVDRLQGVALKHGCLIGRLHFEEPGHGRVAEAELLQQGLVVRQPKLEGGPVEGVDA